MNRTLARRIEKFKIAQTLNWATREGLYRHLSSQIYNGIPIESALASFRKRLARRKQVAAHKAIEDVSRRMRDGATLADAFSPWIPQDEFGVISAGELSGSLPKSLDLIIESKRRIKRVYSALKGAMVNPVIYFSITFGMLWVIGEYITPGLETSLPKEKAHGMVRALYDVGDFVTSWWVLIPMMVFFGVIVAVIRSLPTWTGKNRIAAERFFPYSFYRDMHGYTWLMSFTQLLRAGLPDTEILKRQKAQGSDWLKERMKAIWYRMDNGASLPAALLEPGKHGLPPFGFPNPDIVDDIESMSGFPDFPDKISVLAIQWAIELEEKTLAGAKSFGLTMEMFMYVLMAFLMLAINDLSSQLSAAHGT